jgi:hypothetical protein
MEHFRPNEPDDLPDTKQTLDAGGAPVFNEPDENDKVN